MVTYLVGSRHEATGHTGATHLLEHLMFKGSRHYPPKDGVSFLDRLGEKGALINASTWLDRTNYYEVVPDEYFEQALAMESDRMRYAIITRKDLDEEMPAVRSEYAVGENDPLEALDTQLWATAYQAHPYHHSTIGWLSDIENVPVERLQQFYDTYYWPNNAYVTIVGNVTRDRALTLVRNYFGMHAHSPHTIPTPYTKEPEQTGRRFFEMNRSGTKELVGVAWKVPEALHNDTAALFALAGVLADGKTARLHRALVEKGFATSVQSFYMSAYDPSLMILYVTLAHGTTHEKVEAIIHREVATLVRSGVTQRELARVLADIQTEMAFARDGHYATLSAINEAIAVGDWRYFFDLPNALGKVKRSDVRTVAQRYLRGGGMTIGYYRATI